MFRRMPAPFASTSRRTAAARWPTGTPLPIPSTRLPYADGPTRCEGRVTVALNQSLSGDDRCGGRLGYGGRRSHKDNPRSGGGEVQGEGGRGRVPGSLTCLLYTSDAADDLLCVDLGCRR